LWTSGLSSSMKEAEAAVGAFLFPRITHATDFWA
jgi:hypothetical protein